MSYNGWTNYATWRINLEVFDGVTLEDLNLSKDIDAYELRNYLEDYLLEIIREDSSSNGLTSGWAVAFMQQANLDEIAKHLLEP